MNAIHSHRQPNTSPADVASGTESSPVAAGTYPSRVLTPDATHAGGGGAPASAGSPSNLARALRLYGGPTLETRRDDANEMVLLSGALAIISGGFAMLVGGEGVPLVPLIAAGICFAALLMFTEAVTRRNRIQRRIDDVDAKVEAALGAVLFPVAT